MSPTDQEKIATVMQIALESRLARMIKVAESDLPPMSLGEILSVLFAMHGHCEVLGGYGPSAAGIVTLIGPEIFWRRPKTNSDSAESATIQ